MPSENQSGKKAAERKRVVRSAQVVVATEKYDGITAGNIDADISTHDRFVSVSGEIAQGGSIESDGPVIHQGHVLINSGYLFGGRMPGNALLVFAPHGD